MMWEQSIVHGLCGRPVFLFRDFLVPILVSFPKGYVAGSNAGTVR